MNQKVDILGTEYEIALRRQKDDPGLKELDGYCDSTVRLIVVCEFEPSSDGSLDVKSFDALQKKILRHEIVHAFLYESGLSINSGTYGDSWAKNEEMVDWIAIQGVKIYNAWKEADCL